MGVHVVFLTDQCKNKNYFDFEKYLVSTGKSTLLILSTLMPSTCNSILPIYGNYYKSNKYSTWPRSVHNQIIRQIRNLIPVPLFACV